LRSIINQLAGGLGALMSRLTWDDLVIRDIAPDDCQQWLAPWSWLVDGRLAVEFLNKFGSWFIRRPEGHVEVLDVLRGTIEQIADSYEAFIRLVNEQWWQEDYLLSESVYALHQQGIIPGTGQCYALAPHPALGGPNPANGEQIDHRFVMVMDIPVWQSLCAEFLQGQSRGESQGEEIC
jgi:hypothetical protein